MNNNERPHRRVAAALAAGLAALLAPIAHNAAQLTERPDFSGVWLAFAGGSPGQAGAAARLSPSGMTVVEHFASHYSEMPDPGAWCVPNGMPGVMLSLAGYPIEILHSNERLTMLAEMEMQVRRIYLDGRSHPEDYPATGIGHSIGRWDGDTLIIDTALLKEWPLRPWPRSESARITERMRLTKLADIDVQRSGFITQGPLGDDVLVVELTLTDPDIYIDPQRRTVYFQRIEDSATLEYDCPVELWLQELERHRIGE